MSQEPHVSPAGDSARIYKSFEIRTLKMLVQLMNERSISPNELFNSCDTDLDDSVSLQEMQQILLSVKPTLELKEVQVIHNYLDLNANGRVGREDFIQQLTKS